jgi:predicted acylesterase/phospholipase RssA
MTHSTPTAFVLSGGASLGAVQVGMLRALYERQIRPDLIVATSAGAINGAFIASRPQTVETADELAAIWGRVRRAHVFPLNPLSGLLGFLGSRAHMVPSPVCAGSWRHASSTNASKNCRFRCTWSRWTWSQGRSCCSPAGRSWTP